MTPAFARRGRRSWRASCALNLRTSASSADKLFSQMNADQRKWLDIALVAAISVATNVFYFAFAAPDYFFPDSFTYLQPARHLLHGLGFTAGNGVIAALRTPGSPLLL